MRSRLGPGWKGMEAWPVDDSASSGVDAAAAVTFARLDGRAILALAAERGSEQREQAGRDHVLAQAPSRHSRRQILLFFHGCT